MKGLAYIRSKNSLIKSENADQFNPYYIEYHPNWYLERSIRELFSSVARPIVGQTYNFTFCCTDQEYELVTHLFMQKLLAYGILDREDQISSRFVCRKSADVLRKCPHARHTAEFELQVIPGEYTYEELQERVGRAYKLARELYAQGSKQEPEPLYHLEPAYHYAH